MTRVRKGWAEPDPRRGLLCPSLSTLSSDSDEGPWSKGAADQAQTVTNGPTRPQILEPRESTV